MEQELKILTDKERNRVLALLINDLRSPLSVVTAPLKEMLQMTGLPHGMEQKLELVYRNSLMMLDSVDLLLNIYRQSLNDDRLKISPWQPDRLVGLVIRPLKEVMRANGVDLVYKDLLPVGMKLWTDGGLFDFVLRNLLSNALQHIHFTGKIGLSLRMVERDGAACCRIEVSDGGTETVNVIGEGNVDGFASVELGYTVVRRVVEKLRGHLSLNRLSRGGTLAAFDLPTCRKAFEGIPDVEFVAPELRHAGNGTPMDVRPISEPGPASSQAEPDEPATDKASDGRKKLLVIEDNADVRLYLKVILKNEYDVVEAANGKEGVEAAVREMPDLILSDVMMPVMDGFECCRLLKESSDTCAIPVIMLTAKTEEEDIMKGLELGAEDYILKPFTAAVLKAKVRTLINNRMRIRDFYSRLVQPVDGNDDDGTAETDIEQEITHKDPFISKVIELVKANLRNPQFSVQTLAADLNMSQPTLYRKVKLATDYTIVELIRSVRMRHASVLLKRKLLTVQEVAEAVGYNDIPTFRKHFINTYGVVPSSYKE